MSRAARDLTSSKGPLFALDEAVSEGILEKNASQRLAAEHLQLVFDALKTAPASSTSKKQSGDLADHIYYASSVIVGKQEARFKVSLVSDPLS